MVVIVEQTNIYSMSCKYSSSPFAWPSISSPCLHSSLLEWMVMYDLCLCMWETSTVLFWFDKELQLRDFLEYHERLLTFKLCLYCERLWELFKLDLVCFLLWYSYKFTWSKNWNVVVYLKNFLYSLILEFLAPDWWNCLGWIKMCVLFGIYLSRGNLWGFKS